MRLPHPSSRFMLILLWLAYGIFCFYAQTPPLFVTILVIAFSILGLSRLEVVSTDTKKQRYNIQNELHIQKQHEYHQKVRQSFITLLNALDTPICIIDSRNILRLHNNSFKQVENAPLIDHPIHQTLRYPDLLQAIKQTKDDQQSRGGQIFIQGKDRYFNFEYNLITTSIPLSDPYKQSDVLQESYHYYILSFFDATFQKHLLRARADFVANASHELRTPLSSLKGYIETLQTSAKHDSEAQDKFLEIMHVQAERMGRLIDDLLYLSKIEARGNALRDTAFDAVQIVNTVITELTPLATMSDVVIRFDPAVETLDYYGEKDDFTILTQNLIENAIKYGAEGKFIDINISLNQYSSKEHQLILKVQDYGIGIEREHIPRVTERFYRVNNQLSREKGGTGLGLSITRNIIERYNGQLKIESEVSKGSIFYAILPFT